MRTLRPYQLPKIKQPSASASSGESGHWERKKEDNFRKKETPVHICVMLPFQSDFVKQVALLVPRFLNNTEAGCVSSEERDK